ncbi:hypothetical protein [Prauserella cavernicola]|uniref:Uncharacterized protein n=1 Tax=Prauserella cavernicola TaxID=2800127 RepID=A0A934QY95_9PSEU|nr:hypothetical protein [Prauserella cavernicola]MBK1787499.1 hypothetical protein [Prauserella cavernicola]
MTWPHWALYPVAGGIGGMSARVTGAESGPLWTDRMFRGRPGRRAPTRTSAAGSASPSTCGTTSRRRGACCAILVGDLHDDRNFPKPAEILRALDTGDPVPVRDTGFLDGTMPERDLAREAQPA